MIWVEGKDSNQDLTPKQVLVNHTLKLGTPHKKVIRQKNKTKQKLKRWATTIVIYREHGLLIGQLSCLAAMWEPTREAKH